MVDSVAEPSERIIALVQANGARILSAVLAGAAMEDLDGIFHACIAYLPDAALSITAEALTREARIALAQNPNTFLRMNTVATKLLGCYTRDLEAIVEYMRSILAPTVRPIVEDQLHLSIGESCQKVKHVVSSVVECIVAKALPRELVTLCRLVHLTFHREARLQNVSIERDHQAVSGFLFLRLICSGLVDPFAWRVVDTPLEASVSRSLVLVSRILSQISTGSLFLKPDYVPFNDIIEQCQPTIASFFRSVCPSNTEERPTHWQVHGTAAGSATAAVVGKDRFLVALRDVCRCVLPRLGQFLQPEEVEALIAALDALPQPSPPQVVRSPGSLSPEQRSSADGRAITMGELRQHASTTSCWMAIDGKVYDVTSFASQHPGREETIYSCAGKDATAEFASVNHTSAAVSMLTKYYVGYLVSSGPRRESAVNSAEIEKPREIKIFGVPLLPPFKSGAGDVAASDNPSGRRRSLLQKALLQTGFIPPYYVDDGPGE